VIENAFILNCLADAALVANGGDSFETGDALVRDGFADDIACWAPFLSNPDLVDRFGDNLSLSSIERDTC
jgi:N-ethylmaleimide reductase